MGDLYIFFFFRSDFQPRRRNIKFPHCINHARKFKELDNGPKLQIDSRIRKNAQLPWTMLKREIGLIRILFGEVEIFISLIRSISMWVTLFWVMLSILAPYRRFLRLLSKRGALTLFCIIPVMKIISVIVWFSCFNCRSMILLRYFSKTKHLGRHLARRMSVVLVESFPVAFRFIPLACFWKKQRTCLYMY